MVSVRPEHGPSAVTYARPYWLKLPMLVRVLIAVLVVFVLAAAVYKKADEKSTLHDAIVKAPIAFSLGYPTGMERVASDGDELLHLSSTGARKDRQSFVVSPLHLAAYRGDVSAAFLTATAKMVAEMQRNYPGFVYRGEGRVRVASLPGYQIQFSAKRDDTTVYGRRVLIVPDEPGARVGLDVTMLADRSPAVVNVDAVGANGLLKGPYRSLRFGTERHGGT